ncbi:MAG: DUF58 domain-containing protein [Bdellovibrionales bacterium]|nr:DUF58 domain-containing protein [Bdellovibrionales bacterium]
MVAKWFQKLLSKFKFQFNQKILKNTKNQKRPYIVPSRFGLYFGLGILVLLLLAFTYANQLIYLIAFFYASFLFIVMHLTNNNIKFIKVESYQIDHFFKDQKGKLKVTLKNEHRRYLSRYVYLKVSKTNQIKLIPQILPQQSITLYFDIQSEQRGLFAFPEISIYTTFPFEIFYSWKKSNWSLNYFVFPEREGDDQPPIIDEKALEKESLFTNQLNLSQGVDFLYHREFVPGDNFHRIDWKVFARKNKFYVKTYDNPNSAIYLIDLPVLLDQANGNVLERKINQITKWIYTAQTDNLPCMIQFFDSKLTLLKTPKEFQSIYEKLALFPRENSGKEGTIYEG